MDNGIRNYGPGKFDTMLDAYVYKLSLHGCDDECGESDTTGWHGILRGIQVDGAFCDVGASADVNEDEKQFLREHSAGAIVSEDSQGFVTVEYFDNEDKREKAWSEY